MAQMGKNHTFVNCAQHIAAPVPAANPKEPGPRHPVARRTIQIRMIEWCVEAERAVGDQFIGQFERGFPGDNFAIMFQKFAHHPFEINRRCCRTFNRHETTIGIARRHENLVLVFKVDVFDDELIDAPSADNHRCLPRSRHARTKRTGNHVKETGNNGGAFAKTGLIGDRLADITNDFAGMGQTGQFFTRIANIKCLKQGIVIGIFRHAQHAAPAHIGNVGHQFTGQCMRHKILAQQNRLRRLIDFGPFAFNPCQQCRCLRYPRTLTGNRIGHIPNPLGLELINQRIGPCIKRLNAKKGRRIITQKIQAVAVTRTANGGNVSRINAGFFDDFGHNGQQIIPQLINIALDKARRGTMRHSFAAGVGNFSPGRVEQHGLNNRVARINAKKITCHQP